MDKIFKLENTYPCSKAEAVFYMIYATGATFKIVVDQIRSVLDLEKPVKNKYHVIVIPTSLFLFEDALEELGLFDPVVSVYSFHWQPLYLDKGILSLEFPDMYSQIFVRNDNSLLPVYARSLWHLFFTLGQPNFTIALGQTSNVVLKQLDAMLENIGATEKYESDFGGLVIMDRSVDYPSALLTPCTYAALLKEVYEVRCGMCEHKDEDDEKYDSKFNPMIKKHPINFVLDSTQDLVYREIRNRYFTEVTSVLSNLTKQLKKETADSKEMALEEIKRYVKTQLQATQSRKKFIANHLTAAECIINVMGPRFEHQQQVELNIMQNKNKSGNFTYVEELLTVENNEFTSLRLFCLLCITQKLSESEIKSFWKKYLHEFGYKYAFALDNLIAAGFIQENQSPAVLPMKIMKMPRFSTNNFYTTANKLKQIPSDPEKIDPKHPTCCSYVFGGAYIPLIAQIASMVLNTTPIEEIKTKLESLGSLTVRNERGYPLQPRLLLVYIIGGVTYAEIAACNLLEALTGSRIIVLSDQVVSGNDLMKGILSLPDG